MSDLKQLVSEIEIFSIFYKKADKEWKREYNNYIDLRIDEMPEYKRCDLHNYWERLVG